MDDFLIVFFFIILPVVLAFIFGYRTAKNKFDTEHSKTFAKKLTACEQENQRLKRKINSLLAEIKNVADNQTGEIADTQKKITALQKKLLTMRELYNAVDYSVKNNELLSLRLAQLYDELCPSVTLKLHCMEMKDLQKEFRANDKLIQQTVLQFESRYNTKTIAAIYKLMAIAMRSELQNILYALKYEKLDTAIDSVKEMTAKYYAIASEGNQTIAGTLREYIAKIEYLFINAVKIEHNYYVKKEQAKAEQAAIREQMRIEAAEKKALEEERKKIEREESKYNSEIQKINESLSTSKNDDERAKFEARIAELQAMLAAVAEKKEEIVHLQNGKAGTVYVISNLGAFGDDVFKIGMTRRQEPQDRIDELGDASVPFEFDVHSFIFSEDAVALENKLHTILDKKRLNKVNRRKEFFKISLDELQKLVYEIEPTASFNMTMTAEEYRQSLSVG